MEGRNKLGGRGGKFFCLGDYKIKKEKEMRGFKIILRKENASVELKRGKDERRCINNNFSNYIWMHEVLDRSLNNQQIQFYGTNANELRYHIFLSFLFLNS